MQCCSLSGVVQQFASICDDTWHLLGLVCTRHAAVWSALWRRYVDGFARFDCVVLPPTLRSVGCASSCVKLMRIAPYNDRSLTDQSMVLTLIARFWRLSCIRFR